MTKQQVNHKLALVKELQHNNDENINAFYTDKEFRKAIPCISFANNQSETSVF